MKLSTRTIALPALAALLLLASCTQNKPAEAAKTPDSQGALSTATEAYIYGYPLVTMDMTRRQFTNVSVPDAAHAPMGQLLKLRAYPAVDNHAVTVPHSEPCCE